VFFALGQATDPSSRENQDAAGVVDEPGMFPKFFSVFVGLGLEGAFGGVPSMTHQPGPKLSCIFGSVPLTGFYPFKTTNIYIFASSLIFAPKWVTFNSSLTCFGSSTGWGLEGTHILCI